LGNVYQWYDKTDFGAPASGRFGTCGQKKPARPGTR
jgi:hypothetical protein